ncbi:hypothetical protein PLANTIT3_60676 [Plantibacter sp. T3]|nr:hypothetical protein PLANTIT3_60676 [Plantibacter sp. T3]
MSLPAESVRSSTDTDRSAPPVSRVARVSIRRVPPQEPPTHPWPARVSPHRNEDPEPGTPTPPPLRRQHVAAQAQRPHQPEARRPRRTAEPYQNAVGYRWRETIAPAGHAGIRLHDLRRFYASGLIAAGRDIVTAQRTLRHSSATSKLNRYSPLWPTAQDRTRLAAASIMRPAVLRFADAAADQEALSPVIWRENGPHQTLKRNSTTSPSCMT